MAVDARRTPTARRRIHRVNNECLAIERMWHIKWQVQKQNIHVFDEERWVHLIAGMPNLRQLLFAIGLLWFHFGCIALKLFVFSFSKWLNIAQFKFILKISHRSWGGFLLTHTHEQMSSCCWCICSMAISTLTSIHKIIMKWIHSTYSAFDCF